MKKSILIALILLFLPYAANATADGCAIVLETPDGFLNLREAPMVGARIVAKLKPGWLLDADTAECKTKGKLSICNEDWTHVTSVSRLDGKNAKKWTQGWVANRFIRWITNCDESSK